jgi:hypothetical protein
VFRALLHRCALIAAVAAPLASVVPAPALAGDINPCALVSGNLVTALTGAPATSVRDAAKAVGTDAQDTCHYAAGPANTLVVAYHADPAQFAEIAARPPVQPLAGLGTDALWWSKAGVICALKNGQYISMTYSGDVKKAAPSPAFLAAAKAAVSKL